MAANQAIERTEAWFRSRGVPHFIEDYSARRDILTRALPFLTFVFLVEVFLALNLDWPWWANMFAVAGGVGVLLGGWGAANRLRGRSFLARPESVGATELAVFLLVPAALPLIFDQDAGDAGLTVAANVAVLVVVYVTISYALLPILRWAALRLVREMGDVLRLFARALPLLLLFITFLFINAESWRVAGRLEPWLLGAVAALFALVALAFVLVRLPHEIGALATFASAERLAALCAGTPMAGAAEELEAVPASPPLRWRDWLNVGLVVLFAQALQVVFVAAVVAFFLGVLGVLAIDASVVADWTGGEADELASIEAWGADLALTTELLKVVGFLGAFGGLYFAVNAATNREYREEFFEDIVGDVRRAFAVRAVYLEVLREPEASRGAGRAVPSDGA